MALTDEENMTKNVIQAIILASKYVGFAKNAISSHSLKFYDNLTDQDIVKEFYYLDVFS